MNCSLHSCASYFARYLGRLPSWQFFELLHNWATAAFYIRDFHRLEQKNEIVRKIVMPRWIQHPWTKWSSWSFCKILCKRFLVDSWTFTMHANFDFRMSDSSHISLCPEVFSLHGMATSIGNYHFSVRILWFLWTPYHPDHVKLRILDNPLLHFLTWTCFFDTSDQISRFEKILPNMVCYTPVHCTGQPCLCEPILYLSPRILGAWALFTSCLDFLTVGRWFSFRCHAWETLCFFCVRGLWDLNSGLAFKNSLGFLKNPNPSWEIDSRSLYTIPNLRDSISLTQILLLYFSPASTSSTWFWGFLLERKWLQENIERFMMSNKRRKWFHTSRVKLPLVNMSANWFLVSTYFILIWGSKLILSTTNQARLCGSGTRVSSSDFGLQ